MQKIIDLKKKLGDLSEERASQVLKNKNYLILARNIRFYGVELDFICKQDQSYTFFEVKTIKKNHYDLGYPILSYRQKIRFQRSIEAWQYDIQKINNANAGLIVFDEFLNLLCFEEAISNV